MSGHPSLPTIIVLIGCSIVIVSCSVPGTSGTWDSPSLTGSFAEPSVSLPSRRPDTTAIIESVNANELVVIEVPQMERQSGSGSGTGTSQRSGSTNRLFGGGGMRMGGGPGGPPWGPGSSQSSAELEKLLKSWKRLRVKIPIGIPIGMPATGTGTVGPSEGSFSDIRVGSRAAIWFVPDSISGSSKTAAAILITGKVER